MEIGPAPGRDGQQGTNPLTNVATFGANGLAGYNPGSGLVADAQGNLYGSTQAGLGSSGTLFKVDTGTGAVTTLATFAGGAGGDNPFLSLAVDRAGNLFGTTTGGGTNGYGTVFELAAKSSTITT